MTLVVVGAYFLGFLVTLGWSYGGMKDGRIPCPIGISRATLWAILFVLSVFWPLVSCLIWLNRKTL